MSREFDIVVYGGSGFTGVRVVEYLVKKVAMSKPNLKIAAAARSESKFRGLLAQRLAKTQLKAESVPFIKADSGDETSINAMCKRAKVIIACVGPFRLYGAVVVRACVANGCDYVDITGEPLFIENAALRHHNQAKQANVLIIPACGFDSVPADLGVAFTIQQFEEPSIPATVESYLTLHSGKSGITGNSGTYETILEGVSQTKELASVRKLLQRPKLPLIGRTLKRKTLPFYENRLARWVLPFPGADATVVKNSQILLYELNSSSKIKYNPVQFAAYCYFPSLFMCLATLFGMFTLFVVAQISFLREIFKKNPDRFTFGVFSSKGPTDQQIAESSFSMTFFAKGYSNAAAVNNNSRPDVEVVTRVSGPEVGYVTTVICVCEAAFTVLEEKETLPLRGVLTPAAAFHGSSYISRLQKNGMNFTRVSARTTKPSSSSS